MQPSPDDLTINLPITFDYRGGRQENKKGKILSTLIIVLLTLLIFAGLVMRDSTAIWQKFVYCATDLYVGLFLLRFCVFKELHFSDMYESLKEKDFRLDTTSIWQIFDIDFEYPYICYYKNGYKGIFVKMEKGAITGKPETAVYDHHEAISDAYNRAHSLNMNVVPIDYMDNVGNDDRLRGLYNDLSMVENPDMQDMLIDIYDNLQDEMSENYASFDIYLFLTKDNLNNFIYNVQSVLSTMLGGNYITYRVMNRADIQGACIALFNLYDFSIVEACECVLSKNYHSGVIPISYTDATGHVEVFNKTVEEKRVIAAEQERKRVEQKREQEEAKRRRKLQKKTGVVYNPLDNLEDEDLDIFGNGSSKVSLGKDDLDVDSNKKEDVSDDEDMNLFD